MENTFKKGQVKVLVYKEKEGSTWYASALELDLTIDSDDRSVALFELHEAIKNYIQSAEEIGDISLLNQEPDPELLSLWGGHISNSSEPIESPYTSFSASVETLEV